MNTKFKVLVLDIELAPMEAFIWQLKDQYVNIKQIKTDWSVLAWSAKWLGDPPSKLIYRSTEGTRDIRDDRKILVELRKLLDEADIVLHQNGERFDCLKLTARFIIHRMKPPKPFRQIDTFKIAKKIAAFTSNSLEYLTHKLNRKYKKLSGRKFAGLALWIACLERNKEAWAEMRKYNTHDVLSTEELYMNLRPWIPENVPKVYRVLDAAHHCGICGYSGDMAFHYKSTNKCVYKQYTCPMCGTHQTGEKVKVAK